MRALVLGAALMASVCARPGVAGAQEASAAGSLGVGMFGDRPATTVDAGIDVAGDGYAFGLGARLRYLAGEGVRSEDWDQPSEVARIIRYLVITRSDPVRASAAVGELGGIGLGHGSIVDRYTSGLDVDHGHVGAHVTAAWQSLAFESFIDDVIAPRIAGSRGTLDLGRGVTAGASAVIDMRAPAMDGSAVVPLVGVDVEARGTSHDGLFDGLVYADVVGARTGAGMHLGAGGSVALGDTRARLGARTEARLATGGYVPTWIGPLYERTRERRLERAREGGMGGAGGLFELTLDVAGAGTASASWAQRPGLPRLAMARLEAPYRHGIQAAVWAAAEVGGDDPARGLALEARARLPGAMFIALEAARLYQRDEMDGFRPLWIATAAVGAVVGE